MSVTITNQTATKKRSARDYQFGNTIGEGSYSTVYSAVDIHNSKTYAIKVLSKRHIVKEDKIKYVNIEKTTLHRLGLQHPGIVQLYYTFQDESSLFFVLDFAEYGELLSIIRKFGSLSEQVSLFYMIQLVDAVKFIHSKGIIHRDLKPENILVGIDFNLKVTDFGAAKLLDINDGTNNVDDEKIDYNSISKEVANENVERKASFVGTAEYVAPELLKHNSCGFESDIWALGCILYQFFYGSPPFKGQTEYLTFEKIINIDYSYKPAIPLPNEVVQIIDQVLLADPIQRLTIPQIQTCNWFKNVQWNDPNYIWGRKVPRFEPYEANGGSSNFMHSSPYSPAMKTGSNRNMNKSNSQQHLHTQIHTSDFTLVPSVGAKKAYQPATKIKKFGGNGNPNISPTNPAIHNNLPINYSPPKLGLAISNGPSPQFQAHPLSQPQMSPQMPSQMPPQMSQSSPQVRTQPPNQPPPMQPPPMQNAPMQSAPNQSAPNQSSPTQKIQPSPPMAKPQVQSTPPMLNMRSGSSYFDIQNKPPSPNVRNNTAFAPKLQKKLSNPITSPYYQQPSNIVSRPNLNMNHASAAAAAVGNLSIRSNTSPKDMKPQTPKESPKESPKEQKPEPKTQLSQQNFVKDSIHKIKFKEVSGLLIPNEKILKLDVILKSELSNKFRVKNQVLDDSSIEKLINKYEPTLTKESKPVVTIVTNMARVFFIDGGLNVMLIDLKANNGSDYSMYDYEFESIAVDSDEEENELGEEVYGYLILELTREGGDLIFLKRISDQNTVKDNVMVVDKSGKEVKLGVQYGWIDCLLVAKDMVAKKSKETAKAPKKEPVAKRVKPKSNYKPATNGDKGDRKNFAYAAAAAAHKT